MPLKKGRGMPFINGWGEGGASIQRVNASTALGFSILPASALGFENETLKTRPQHTEGQNLKPE